MRKITVAKTAFCIAACYFVALNPAFAAKKKKATAPAMPEWVNVPAVVYPNDAYITYVGNAPDRDSAEIKALQGIAGVFEQSVKSTSEASERMIKAKADGKVASASENTFSQNIRRTVDVDNLVGVEAKEFWFDGQSTWYAIAVLDKENAAGIYGDMIRKNASTMSAIVSRSRSDKNSFDSYAAYDFVEDIALENESHLKKMSVIKPSAVPSLKSACPSSKEFHAKKMEIAKRIPICVVVDNDEGGRLAATFSEAVSSLGFRGSYDGGVRYVLTSSVHFERSDASDGKTTRCRYNVEGYLLDTATQQQLVPFTLSGREGHVDYPEAKNRAVKSLEAKIKKDFASQFSAYLKNLIVE